MTTGAEVKSALLYRERVQAMVADEDLTGDLLLLALTLTDALLREGESGNKKIKRSSWVEAVRVGCGWGTWRKVSWTIARDFPRYEPEETPGWTRPCSAPMVRRDGPCGQPGSGYAQHFDPETGRRWWAYSCSRHRSWAQAEDRRTRAAWKAAGEPEPPHNAGGVLARHFSGDWSSIYRWAAPHHTATPGTGKPPTPPKPKLTLIKGGAR